jgi:hypothetical protein
VENKALCYKEISRIQSKVVLDKGSCCMLKEINPATTVCQRTLRTIVFVSFVTQSMKWELGELCNCTQIRDTPDPTKQTGIGLQDLYPNP